MLTIEVELLTGRYVATSHNDRTRAEWPPHPARLFSALVAAMHENEPVDAGERDALLWLERQPPPSMDVDMSVGENVGRRQVVDVYVPVNDVSIVGDVEMPLREARSALDRAEQAGADQKILRKVRQDVSKAENRLQDLLAKQQLIDDKPTAESLRMAAALLPDRRIRQVRTFPVVVPEKRTFTFIWADEPPTSAAASLLQLCNRVTRLGHSSSLVRCTIADHTVEPTLIPGEHGHEVLRVVGPGQVERLEAAHDRHHGVESRALPSIPQRYGPPSHKSSEVNHPQSVFSDEWILFERVGGARPLSSRGIDLARALRDTLFEHHGTADLPASLSGHGRDGGPADRPHAAFVSLPFVGTEYSDASIQGCAIVLPRAISALERQTLLRLVASLEKSRRDGVIELARGTLPPVRVRRIGLTDKKSLRSQTWCRSAQHFVTATPIALDRYPGNLRSNLAQAAHKAALEAQRTISDGCERIGLPRPISVAVSFAPALLGTQPANAFLPGPGKPGRPPRVRVHAELQFGQEVRGPILIGAGRYFGLGLCMPIGGWGQ